MNRFTSTRFSLRGPDQNEKPFVIATVILIPLALIGMWEYWPHDKLEWSSFSLVMERAWLYRYEMMAGTLASGARALASFLFALTISFQLGVIVAQVRYLRWVALFMVVCVNALSKMSVAFIILKLFGQGEMSTFLITMWSGHVLMFEAGLLYALVTFASDEGNTRDIIDAGEMECINWLDLNWLVTTQLLRGIRLVAATVSIAPILLAVVYAESIAGQNLHGIGNIMYFAGGGGGVSERFWIPVLIFPLLALAMGSIVLVIYRITHRN